MERNKIFIKNIWKTIEKNNMTIALNILYFKEKEILSACISNHI